jgi:protein translocase SecG subunit
VVLIQRSEGGGLGIGSSQGMGSFMSGRGTANLLTRTTAILATVFMALSLTLALMNRGTTGVGGSLLDMPAAPESQRRDVDSILPTREESLATLESTATGFDAFVAAIPANADTTRTMLHQRFGEMSSKGWMLLMALHEGDHLRQIRALAD